MARGKAVLGIGLGVLVAILVIVVVVVVFVSGSRLNRVHDVPEAALAIPDDPRSVERGRHLAHSVLACNGCHGDDLGGELFIDAAPMGTIPAPNLTPAGVGATYEASDWIRAIRHGVDRQGRGLLWMPTRSYEHLTDGEVAAVVAYLQSLEPVQRTFGERKLGPISRMILAFGAPLIGAERIDHDRDRSDFELTSTLDWGRHLANIGGCTHCHRPDYSGGKVDDGDPSWPPASNLTPHADGLGRYRFETFAMVMRTGQTIDGRAIDPGHMPWESYAALTDEELEAIWSFLQSVEPKPATR